MPAKEKRFKKPTVFLSHSSTNRRELLALKRLLDDRAGGMIEFFLSSDDDSITHGTIWPAEVRAALDRMSLMHIFVSPEALKSGWTYFEAGYGLHKLGMANIYCLPGSEKSALPSPFNILQNRNLHSAKDITLLIRQINGTLEGKMDEHVSRNVFDQIFKRPLVGRVESGPKFEEVVSGVNVKTVGPPNSMEIFSRVCTQGGFPVSAAEGRKWNVAEGKCSTGVRILVESPGEEELLSEFLITDEIRKAGEALVVEYSNGWRPFRVGWIPGLEPSLRTVNEIELQNSEVAIKNKQIGLENDVRQAEPRECEFILSPINIAVPIEIIDRWVNAAKPSKPVIVTIDLLSEVLVETKIEAISAKIHGSDFSLRSDAALFWAESIVLTIEGHTLKLEADLTTANGKVLGFEKFCIPDIVTSLFELGVISLPSLKKNKRRR